LCEVLAGQHPASLHIEQTRELVEQHGFAVGPLRPPRSARSSSVALKFWLVARNRALEVLEKERQVQKVSKKVLADRAGLDYASVRRLLTSTTANPTSETMLRLFSALQIRVQAKLPVADCPTGLKPVFHERFIAAQRSRAKHLMELVRR
jgi:hypothetical protein